MCKGLVAIWYKVVIIAVFLGMPAWPVMSADLKFQVERFIVEGDNPLGDIASIVILDPYTGEHTGIERLRQAAAALESALNDKGYDFHRVTLPQQVLDAGAVVLEIRNLVIDEITTSGNKYFSDENIRRSLPQLKKGETPNTRSLSRALAIANFNTAKRTRLTFGRGGIADTLDARIEVRDRPPQQIYAWLNNTGSAESTRSRMGIGYQHRNLFDRDHSMTATYTTSPEDPDKVQQYGVNYQVPAYFLTGLVNIFHVQSDVDSGRVADVFDVNGGGVTTGLRYSQVLNKRGVFRQRIYVDVTDKLFDNNVDFLGNQIGVDVRSRPLAATWQLEWEKPASDGHLNISYATNLEGGEFNSQVDYSASRVGAPQDWSAIRIEAGQNINLPRKWRLAMGLQGLFSDDPLIGGEQLGLGGSRGPRGFEEREAGVDRGINLKFQVWAPTLTGNLQIGGFLDHGFGTRLNPQVGEELERDLTSIGIGSKWQWQDRLVLTLDFGHVVGGLEGEPGLTQDGDNRIHAGLVYRISGD